MIFINLVNFKPDDDWQYEAWLLNAELKAKKTIAEKLQLIDENRDFWSRLKAQLPYNDKCWYSEAKESVSVYEVEHFRPVKATSRSKSILKVFKQFVEAQRKDWTSLTKYKGLGYWWLAFDCTNYRNCGKKINLTKSTRFPLIENSFIAHTEADDYKKEDMYLLDPTKDGDSELLTFDPDGKARPTITDKDTTEFARAFVSIETYGLNKIDALVKHRETKWSDCYKAIIRASNKFVELEEATNEGNTELYFKLFDEFMDFIENDIKPAIHPSSEFSSVAKACVLSYSKYGWILDYVLAA
jgi:hypothetical protein